MAKKKFPPMRHPGKGCGLQGRFKINNTYVRIYSGPQKDDDRDGFFVYTTTTILLLEYEKDDLNVDVAWVQMDETFETLSGACYMVLNRYARA